MTALWTSHEAAEALGVDTHHDWEAFGISIDSRTLSPGDLFIALEGERFDGHAYVVDAEKAGAAAALVSKQVEGVSLPQIVVPDTMEGLYALARAGRRRSHARIMALTGSVGKTTTRAMITSMLSAFGHVHATVGNLNNHIGAPLTLARMPKEATFGVFELGMNHAGEISPLSSLVQPELAMIIAIEAVHIEFFDSLAGIAHAKAEIMDGLGNHGTVILNGETNHLDILTGKAKEMAASIRYYGAQQNADIRLSSWRQQGWHAEVNVQTPAAMVSYRLAHPGRHMAMNSLAAIALADAWDLDITKAARALEQWQPETGRGNTLSVPYGGGAITIVDDSYNASPASVMAALEVMQTLPGRKIVALGDMLELGDDAPAYHRSLAGPIQQAGIDKVIACGPLMSHLADALPDPLVSHAADWQEAAALLTACLQPGDTVLVKGSHGSEMYRLAATLPHELTNSTEQKVADAL